MRRSVYQAVILCAALLGSSQVLAKVEVQAGQHKTLGRILVAKVSEEIVPGDYEALLKGIKANPGKFSRKIVMLDSIGGSVSEAMRIGRLLRETAFDSLVPSTGGVLFDLMAPLHFGNFAGVFSKAVWFALGFAGAYVTLTGLSLCALQVWFARYPTAETLTQFLTLLPEFEGRDRAELVDALISLPSAVSQALGTEEQIQDIAKNIAPMGQMGLKLFQQFVENGAAIRAAHRRR